MGVIVTVMSIRAKWIGPYEAAMPNGVTLIPGETIIEISEGEAKQSAHWQPVSAPRKTAVKSDPED